MFLHRKKRKSGIIIFLIVSVLSLSIVSYIAIAEEEIPDRIFEGREAAEAILKNLDYVDVINSDSWAKNAIWETGALELLKGYGERRFGLSDRITVEEALMIVYTMAGREAEAQLAAEALDLQRRVQERKTPARIMWADGYFQLAFNDGLITQEQYLDALRDDPLGLDPSDFHRNRSVTREDFAFYLARVLEITPLNSQTHLFNAYRDWQNANPHRIPYMEALLQNKVMNGDSQGYFSPKGAVTREQAAPIIQNAEPFVLPRRNMEKLKGTVEGIEQLSDRTDGNIATILLVHVRNSNGTLHRFRFIRSANEIAINEMADGLPETESKGLILNDMGILKDENALREGQEIVYFVSGSKVLYAMVEANLQRTEYYLGRILSIDEPNRRIQSEMLLEMPFPDIRLMDPEDLYPIYSSGVNNTLTVSENALIYMDFVKKSISDIKLGEILLLTLENGLVTGMERVNMDLLQEEGIVSGILQENNPSLGYVTLYFPDGSGTSPNFARNLSNYRTYSYLRPEYVSVFKNGAATVIENLKEGDSVFIKLDKDGNMERISASDNFHPVYGRVRTKGSGTLQLEKTDGTIEQIFIPADIPVFQERRRVTWNDIKEGDNIRVLLQKSGSNVVIGEIILEKERIETTGIYKAQMGYYEEMNKSIVVTRLQQFKDGIWKQPETHGISKLRVNEKYQPEIQKGAWGTVYLATGKDLLGRDTVVRMAMDNQALLTETIADTILEALPGRGSLTFLNGERRIMYGPESLIIKGGKLLEPNQVKSQDDAYVETSSYIDGSLKANMIWLKEPLQDTGLTLLRGRISSIDAYNGMTLESFSQFREPDWEFMNVPKTLSIDPSNIRVFDDTGRTDLVEFDDKGETSYKNRTAYVIQQDGKALLVSTAPFGDVVYKGRIAKLEGMVKDAFGHIVSPPESMWIEEARCYNHATWMWEEEEETNMTLPVNAVIMRNGEVIHAGQLEEGDRVTVIQSTVGENAYVVFAQSF